MEKRRGQLGIMRSEGGGARVVNAFVDVSVAVLILSILARHVVPRFSVAARPSDVSPYYS